MLLDSALLRRLRTYFIPLPANFGARVYRDSTFTHNSSGNWLPIDFSTEREDTANVPGSEATTGYWLLANPTRLTAQKAGWHTIVGHVRWASDAAGYRGLEIYLNGTTPIGRIEIPSIGQNNMAMTVATLYWLESGDYVELRARQDTGGNLNISSTGNYSPEFAIVRIP